MPTPSHPVLDRVLFSTFGHPAPGTDDQPRDDHGRFAPAGGGTGPRPDLHPGAVVSVSQGDGFKITTPHGHIDYRHADGTNEIWWVESHKKGHGSDLVDAMQKNHPAEAVAWGVTTPGGKGLRDKWHAAHPDVAQGNGAFEGQFDPSGDNYGEEEPEADDDLDDDFDGDAPDDDDQKSLFAFDPDKHPRDAHGLFLPADGGVVERLKARGGVPAHLDRASADWAGELTAGQRNAVEEYTDDAYSAVNPALRDSPDGAGLSREVKKFVRHLDAAIRAFPPFAEPVTSWRGLDISKPEKAAKIDAAFNAALATGEPVTLSGFSSADLDPARAAGRSGKGQMVLEITSRRGAYLHAATSCPAEHEILHTHGERFKVVGVRRDKYRREDGVMLPRKTYVLEAVEAEPPVRFGWEDQERAADGRWGSGGAGHADDDDALGWPAAEPETGGAAEDTPKAQEVAPEWTGEDFPPALAKAADRWANRITAAEEQAVAEYTEDGYYEFNHSLRQWAAGGPEPESVEAARLIDKAIRRFPKLKEPVTTYRGMAVRDDAKLAQIEASFRASIATGEPVTFYGFTSSSLDPARALAFDTESEGGQRGTSPTRPVLKIVSRRGAYIESASTKADEHEVLHTHGDRFRVTGVTHVEYTDINFEPVVRRTYTLEAVDEAPPPLPKATFAAFDFQEDQPRAEDGKWTTGGGSAPAAEPPLAAAVLESERPSAYLLHQAQAWAGDLTQSQENAVYEYTGDNFDPINKKLRNCPQTLDCMGRFQDDAARLQAVIAKFPPHDPPLTTYRGVATGRPGVLGKAKLAEIEDGLKAALATGGPITYAGFQSSSIDPSFAAKWATGTEEHGLMLEIKSPRGAYIARQSGKPNEEEVLHAHNESYRVTGVRRQKVKDGNRHLTRTIYTLEAVADKPPAIPFSKTVFGADDQARDDHGRWAASAGGSGTGPKQFDPIQPDQVPEPLKAATAAWVDRIEYPERVAIEAYTGGMFKAMSGVYRDRGTPDYYAPASVVERAEALHAGLAKADPLPEPLTSYRGVKSGDPAKLARLEAAVKSAAASGGVLALAVMAVLLALRGMI